VFRDTDGELFRVRIEETVDWLLREMRLPGGGFASSLDADSEGEEGRFYLWTRRQLDDCLGDEGAARFLLHHELVSPTGWEGDPVLRARSHQPPREALGPEIASLKAQLLSCREKRVRPARDDKLLVDWNGLAISALARAGRRFEREDWIVAARQAFRFVAESERDGRLPHSILGAHSLFPGLSSDYAAMANAAVTLVEATGDSSYAAHAKRWLETLERWHGAESGHYLTASDSGDVPIRIRGDIDEAMPSATAQVIEAMLRTAQATSDLNLHDRAVNTAQHALGRVVQQLYGQAGIIRAADMVRAPRKLVIVDAGEPTLVSVANRFLDPTRTDIVLQVGAAGGNAVLSDGTTLDTSSPGAWLCVGQACLPPVRTPEALAELLRE
jgi:uncharacterized protein YyaL (SSP411 family)